MTPRFDLLSFAHQVIDGIPTKRVHLNVIADNDYDSEQINNPNHCGTIGCALGWLGMHPKFIELGLVTSELGKVSYNDGPGYFYAEVAAEFFNITEWDAKLLFGPMRSSHYDFSMPNNASSKRLFKNRIRQFFINQGQPVRKK